MSEDTLQELGAISTTVSKMDDPTKILRMSI